MSCEYSQYCGSFAQFGESECPERDCMLQITFEAYQFFKEEVDEIRQGKVSLPVLE